jgi:predicted nuclease of predicted toxin-antitoxin system
MKIKLDENLPVRLAILLKNVGHDVQTAYEEQLVGRADSEIWVAAQQESRFLITQDMDFSDARRFAPGTHHGLLLVRLRSPNRRDLAERVEGLFRRENVDHRCGCFVVATERKIRVLRPREPKSS